MEKKIIEENNPQKIENKIHSTTKDYTHLVGNRVDGIIMGNRPIFKDSIFNLPDNVKINNQVTNIDYSTTKFLQLNNCSVIIYNEGISLLLDISNVNSEQFSKEECSQRIKEFDISEYIPVKNKETHREYAKRISRFYDMDYLVSTYKDFPDNLDHILSIHPIEDQFSFASFYKSLNEKDKTMTKTLLENNGYEIFELFKICESSISNGHLILDIYEKFGEEKTLEISKKIISILYIFEELNDKTLGNSINKSGVYSGVMTNAISILNGILEIDSNDNLNIKLYLNKIEEEVIESLILYQNIEKKGLKDWEDLNKLGIEHQIFSNNISKQDKIKIKNNLMELYNEKYNKETEKDFLHEVDDSIDDLLKDDVNKEIHILYANNIPILSYYLIDLGDNEVYSGGLNIRNSFDKGDFGRWILKKALKDNEGKIINASIFKESNGIENERYKTLIKLYKRMGYEILSDTNGKYGNIFTEIKLDLR